jgi:hypothetical protein
VKKPAMHDQRKTRSYVWLRWTSFVSGASRASQAMPTPAPAISGTRCSTFAARKEHAHAGRECKCEPNQRDEPPRGVRHTSSVVR